MEETTIVQDQSAEPNESESGNESQQSQGEKAAQSKAAARELGEQDLDAIVTVKINGETKKIPLREVIKINQLENVSRQRTEEASRLVKQVQSIMTMAKSNPKQFLKETGIDPYDFAESTLAEKFEMMQLSPEQKELLEYKQRLKSYEEKELEDRRNSERAQLSQAEQVETEKLDKEIGEAWKESGLPTTRKAVADIAFEILSASKRGQVLTAKEAALKVRGNYDSFDRQRFDSMDAEAILKIIGEKNMKKIRDFDVKRVTGKAASQNSQSLGAKPTSGAKKAFTSEHEWRDALKQMHSNLKD